jgi:DNA helicase HerA-like ATPase
MEQPLGRVKGPGEAPHTFLVVAPDHDQQLKLGEFITYQLRVEDIEQDVLARITERRPLRLYPDSFLADPTVDPNSVANTVGYTGNINELFELTAEIIGYYDETMRDFINPRVPPRVGTPIAIASHTLLSNVLSRVKINAPGAATIGWLASRQTNAVPIAIDVNAAVSTHLAIIASTGAGKSYTASVLIEEMLRPINRAAILVIDPHGEYNTLDQIANQPALRDGSYLPKAAIKKPGSIKIRVGTLTQSDLHYLLPNMTDRMDYVLNRAYHAAGNLSRRRTGKYLDQWTVDELLASVRQVGQGSDDEDEEDDAYKSTANALRWRIESVLKVGDERVFDNHAQTPLTEFIRPGLCTVMQLNQVDQREQQVIVATLLRRIYQARLQTARGQNEDSDDSYLPYPVFVLIEEAHNFAPAGLTIVSTGILKQILAEGRKFGVGVGLISQRPGKLDPDVLSQCNTQFLLRIVNPVDQARVAESVESVGRELLTELPALNKGQAIISGVAVNTPLICQIRPRYTPHGGESTNAPEEWVRYSQLDQERQQRQRALPFQRRAEDDDLLKR